MSKWKKGAIGVLSAGTRPVRVQVLRVNPTGSLSVKIIEGKDSGTKLCVQPYDLTGGSE